MQAHKLELCVSSVARKLPWMARYERVLRALFRRWKTSPKKAAIVVEAGIAIDDKTGSLKGLHGIRWMASKMSAVVALAKEWRSQVAGLHKELVNANATLRRFQGGVSLATPDAEIVGTVMKKTFATGLFEGTVISFSSRQSASDDDVVLFKVCVIFYSFIYLSCTDATSNSCQ